MWLVTIVNRKFCFEFDEPVSEHYIFKFGSRLKKLSYTRSFFTFAFSPIAKGKRKKIFYDKNASYMFLIILLSSDIELNPGPEDWYKLSHPNMCGFFKTAVLWYLKGKN